MRKILKRLIKYSMKQNRKYFNLHLGQECYIFGNGDSIKYFDLALFSDKISFGCNALRLHKDFQKLNLKYYISVHPLEFAPIWRGYKTGFYLEKNPYYKLHQGFQNTGYIHFVHPSNYLFIKNKTNFRFIHNLNRYPISLEYCDFTTSSSFVNGSLQTMVGLAIYMGFKKAYLVGCDYFFKPLVNGHFWNPNPGKFDVTSYDPKELMDVVEKAIDLTVITREGVSAKINSIQYKKLFGVNETYKNAEKIVSKNDINTLVKNHS